MDDHPNLAHTHSGTSTTSSKDIALERYMKDPYSIDQAMGEVETIRDIRKGAVDRDLPRKYDSSPMIVSSKFLVVLTDVYLTYFVPASSNLSCTRNTQWLH